MPLLATESSNNRNAILIIPIYTSVDHSIGAIPTAERKLCASVDGNICLVGEIHGILLNDFSTQMSPKTINYGGKNLGFSEGRFLQKT